MSRKSSITKRVLSPDSKYFDVYVTKLVNYIMRKGKVDIARNIVYSAFEKVAKDTGRSALEVFKEALERVRPLVQVRSRRVGGATYPVPMEVKLDKSEAIGLRWIVKGVQKRICRNADDSLAKILIDSAKGVGEAMEERKKMHAMADANKAFIHFRW